MGRNNLMFDPVQSQDADLLEQVDRQDVRIRELEQLIHAKSEMLRQMESALGRERNSNEPMIRLQADLAQLKTKNQMLEKENNELRRLCGGDRAPKYLPIAAPSPRNSDSDQSPATEEAGIPLAAKSSSASKSPNKSFRKIFGKVKRSNSGGQLTGQEISPPPPDKYGDLKICLDQKGSIDYRIEETPKSQPFRRGGFRATAGGRLGWSTKPEAGGSQVLSKKPFEDWSLDVIGVWMDSLGLGMYNTDLKKHILVGSHLLKMTSNDLEAKLNMKSAMHRKKLSLALKAKKDKEGAQGGLDHHWVTRWLDDVGLPQYKDTFFEARVDGRVLNVLTIEDLLVHLKITNLLHHLSIRRGIQVLRQNNFAPDALKRRAIPGDSEAHNVSLWSNHRVMEWLREVDLSEYAPNLRGSGVHGALMLLEPRFTADLLATLLSIPTSKTLLRRHLNIHFKELVGKETISAKRLAEQDPNYVALTPTAKAKTKSSGLTLKRKKSKSQFDYDDLLCPFDGGKHPTK